MKFHSDENCSLSIAETEIGSINMIQCKKSEFTSIYSWFFELVKSVVMSSKSEVLLFAE